MLILGGLRGLRQTFVPLDFSNYGQKVNVVFFLIGADYALTILFDAVLNILIRN